MQKDTLKLYFYPPVMLTAVKVAVVVGTILALINHGDALLFAELKHSDMFKIALSYLVPYLVSSYSSVKTLQSMKDS